MELAGCANDVSVFERVLDWRRWPRERERFRDGGDDCADVDAAACDAVWIWPRRRMVSKGSVTKRSRTEEAKVQTE